jgi:hypothetical protein
MQKQLIKKALILLLASLFTSPAFGQGLSSPLASITDNSDEPSGWVRVEIAIFTNAEAEALASEIWEGEPVRIYPPNRRWLTQYGEIKALMDEWGEAAVTIQADGSIDVIPEPVSKPVETALISDETTESDDVTSANALALDSTTESDTAIEPREPVNPIEQDDMAYPLAAEPTDKAPNMVSVDMTLLDQENPNLEFVKTESTELTASASTNVVTPNDSKIAIDELLIDADSMLVSGASTAGNFGEAATSDETDSGPLGSDFDAAPINTVDILNTGGLTDKQVSFDDVNSAFAEQDPLAGPSIDWLNSYVPDDRLEDGQSLAEEAAPPALPAAYQQLRLEMLDEGLSRLQKQADRQPTVSMAWLQPPGGSGAPIVIDTWQETLRYPLLQGTLTFSRGDEATLDIDVWLNTQGDYLPPQFDAISAISLPERILVIETPEVEVQSAKTKQPEFIDLTTGLSTDGAEAVADTPSKQPVEAEVVTNPYRHAIALSELRDIREGYVRYIDHPAIQVIAAWRELSFKEVYDLGETQRIRRDIDSLTRSLTKTSEPGNAHTSTIEGEASVTTAP